LLKICIFAPNNRTVFHNKPYRAVLRALIIDLGSEEQLNKLLNPNVFEDFSTIHSICSQKHKSCKKIISKSLTDGRPISGI